MRGTRSCIFKFVDGSLHKYPVSCSVVVFFFVFGFRPNPGGRPMGNVFELPMELNCGSEGGVTAGGPSTGVRCTQVTSKVVRGFKQILFPLNVSIMSPKCVIVKSQLLLDNSNSNQSTMLLFAQCFTRKLAAARSSQVVQTQDLHERCVRRPAGAR